MTQEGRLRVAPLHTLRPSAAPREGCIVGGVLAAPWYRILIGGADDGARGTSGLGCLLRDDGGGVYRLRILHCPPQEAAQLREGRRVAMLHAWLRRGAGQWPSSPSILKQSLQRQTLQMEQPHVVNGML